MASLLRQGARRIGGNLLQRTQAAVSSPAVAEERRRLVPRRMTTAAHDLVQGPAAEIQLQKEQLYDALCKVGTIGERVLLQDLAAHVNPRPQDAHWCRLRVARRIGNFVNTTGTALFASFVIVVNGVYGGYYAAEREYEMKKQAGLERADLAEAEAHGVYQKAVRRVAMKRENQKKKQV